MPHNNSLQVPVVPKIICIKTPDFPFRFEWHEAQGKVYMVDTLLEPNTGYCIAEHVHTHAAAYGHVQTYLRGFRKGIVHGQKQVATG